MNKPSVQDIEEELIYQARQAREAGEVQPTAKAVMDRYRVLKDWQAHPKEFIFHCVKKYFRPGMQICDFGCGDGEAASQLGQLGYPITGVDLSPELIEKARKRAQLDKVEDKVKFVIANLNEKQPEVYDLLLVRAVLHHIELQEGIKTMQGMMASDGLIVLCEPILLSRPLGWLRNLVPVSKDISPNERQLTQKDIDCVEENFELVEKRYFHMFSRLNRLAPNSDLRLRRLDAMIFNNIPGTQWLAGVVVMVCRKKKGA